MHKAAFQQDRVLLPAGRRYGHSGHTFAKYLISFHLFQLARPVEPKQLSHGLRQNILFAGALVDKDQERFIVKRDMLDEGCGRLFASHTAFSCGTLLWKCRLDTLDCPGDALHYTTRLLAGDD
jgi:hypothetical protein